MKILKYKLATETNHGTPEKPMMKTVLSDVSMPYTTETDYQMALSEAWQGEVTVEEVPETADEIRARRDRLLAATDWAVLPDSPLDAQSLETVKTYRQALRDVPQHEQFLGCYRLHQNYGLGGHMKIIKYQLETEINYGTPEEPDIETLLSPVTVTYTEEAYAIAQDESLSRQITVEDDGVPAPPPTAQEQLRADVDFLAAMQGVAL